MTWKYEIEESSVDVRKFTIECDRPLIPDCKGDLEGMVGEICSEVFGTTEGTSSKGTMEGVNFKVTYDGTDYGDDAQVIVCSVDSPVGSIDKRR